jgi:hypothetical protein
MLVFLNMQKINITSTSKDSIAKILSNLAITPFTYGGYRFKCVEAALQGIKISNKNEREKVFKMNGLNSLKIGRKITLSIKDNEKRYVYWMNKKIPYNSQDHRLLIASFIREKVRQSSDVQKALLKTKGGFIYHDVGFEHPKTSLPEKLFIEILLAERKILSRLLSLK